MQRRNAALARAIKILRATSLRDEVEDKQRLQIAEHIIEVKSRNFRLGEGNARLIDLLVHRLVRHMANAYRIGDYQRVYAYAAELGRLMGAEGKSLLSSALLAHSGPLHGDPLSGQKPPKHRSLHGDPLSGQKQPKGNRKSYKRS